MKNHKSHLLIKKTSANEFKRKFAFRKLFLSLSIILVAGALFTISALETGYVKGAGAFATTAGVAMLTGKIAGKDTATHKADGTEKSVEEQLSFIIAYSQKEIESETDEKLKKQKEELTEQLAAIKDALGKLDPDQKLLDKINKLVENLDNVGAEVKALKENPTEIASTKKSLKAELAANKAKLKELATNKASNEFVVLKTLVSRPVANPSSQMAFDVPDVGQLATRKLVLYDLFPKITVGENNNGTVRYRDWDAATITRAAAAVAEGAAFPESKAQFKTSTIDLCKVGDTLPVTQEFFEDDEMFASELEMFINMNLQLEIDRQLCLGDGTANQMTGIFPTVSAYSVAGAGTIKDANIYDLFVKVSESITTLGGSKYTPNFGLMNITDINRMKLKKDGYNNYLLPPFVSADGKNVAGMIVFECNIVTANTMVIGDSRYARIYEKTGIEITTGVVNDQFTKDELTLKARKRMLFLIRYADLGGFLKVTDIDAAVNALTLV